VDFYRQGVGRLDDWGVAVAAKAAAQRDMDLASQWLKRSYTGLQALQRDLAQRGKLIAMLENHPEMVDDFSNAARPYTYTTHTANMEALDDLSLIPGIAGVTASIVKAIFDLRDGNVLSAFEDALGAVPFEKLGGKTLKLLDDALRGLSEAERSHVLDRLGNVLKDLSDEQAEAMVNRLGDLMKGMSPEERKQLLDHVHELGLDLKNGQFRAGESLAGLHLETDLGRRLERFDEAAYPNKHGDWIDPTTGETYDAVGPVPDWSKTSLDSFEKSITAHLRKEGLDHVYVDMTGLDAAGKARIRQFIDNLDPQKFPRGKNLMLKD